MLGHAKDYDTLYRQFRWEIPTRYNIGVDVCDRWAAADPSRLAILHVRADGRQEAITYGWLRETSNRLANVLRARGIQRGDRVALMLPQAPEVAAIHVAIYKLGAIALPIAAVLSAWAGETALAHGIWVGLLLVVEADGRAVGVEELDRERVPRVRLIPGHLDQQADPERRRLRAGLRPAPSDDGELPVRDNGVVGEEHVRLHGP